MRTSDVETLIFDMQLVLEDADGLLSEARRSGVIEPKRTRTVDGKGNAEGAGLDTTTSEPTDSL
jgi:hypothetical protein